MPDSCIYTGIVRHRRNAPRHHEFNFPVFMLMLDLSELDSIFENNWFWSTRSRAIARFQHEDHLKAYASIPDMRSRALAFLDTNGMHRPIGPIRLLTQLRCFGFLMNPVSFYYCYDLTGDRIEYIIAEVNNTPWGEQHLYVVEADGPGRRSLSTDKIEKDFHVSPFMHLDMDYKMAFSEPGEKLGVKIENHLHDSAVAEMGDVDGKKILDVTMLLNRKPLTSRNLNWMLVKYPLGSFRVFAGIYWQALRLYLKKVPFYPHPAKRGNLDQPTDDPNREHDPRSAVDSESETILVS